MMFWAPAVAPTVDTFKVTCVGLSKDALLTVTPPVTDALMWLNGIVLPPRLDPGSKNPEPAAWVPVRVTFTEPCPAVMLAGLADAGMAGGGAISFTTRTAQELVALLNSCTVHIVMSSTGSSEVNE